MGFFGSNLDNSIKVMQANLRYQKMVCGNTAMVNDKWQRNFYILGGLNLFYGFLEMFIGTLVKTYSV